LRNTYPTGLTATDWTRIAPGVARLVALRATENELLERHAATWVPSFPDESGAQWGGFRRGFPERVTLQAAVDLASVAPHLRANPPVTIELYDFAPELVERLAGAGLLGCVAGIDAVSIPGLRAFVSRPEARGLRTLETREPGEVVSLLTEGPNWTGLHTFELSRAPLGTEDAETLFRATNLPALRRLWVRGSGWSADTIRTLSEGRPTNLTLLRLSYCNLDDDAAEALAACPALANLRELDLAHNRIGGRGATALLCSPHLTKLAHLNLDHNSCTGLDAELLATAEPASLRLLHFHGARMRTADVRALSRCPRLRTLWYLDIDQNNLRTAAVREMVRGFKRWAPPILWLAYNQLDDRAAELLAGWKGAANLSALHIKHNHRMTGAGTRALLDSPHLANLTALGVSTVDPDDVERFKKRFPHPDNY
ncbi:MAG: hypothetical protein K2V38_03805, partial [Gemmataceae bacterium]|nr:hypothetical protein [Gemmataceae bacterium]